MRIPIILLQIKTKETEEASLYLLILIVLFVLAEKEALSIVARLIEYVMQLVVLLFLLVTIVLINNEFKRSMKAGESTELP